MIPSNFVTIFWTSVQSWSSLPTRHGVVSLQPTDERVLNGPDRLKELRMWWHDGLSFSKKSANLGFLLVTYYLNNPWINSEISDFLLDFSEINNNNNKNCLQHCIILNSLLHYECGPAHLFWFYNLKTQQQ